MEVAPPCETRCVVHAFGARNNLWLKDCGCETIRLAAATLDER
jgi:hypothetical protein